MENSAPKISVDVRIFLRCGAAAFLGEDKTVDPPVVSRSVVYQPLLLLLLLLQLRSLQSPIHT